MRVATNEGHAQVLTDMGYVEGKDFKREYGPKHEAEQTAAQEAAAKAKKRKEEADYRTFLEREGRRIEARQAAEARRKARAELAAERRKAQAELEAEITERQSRIDAFDALTEIRAEMLEVHERVQAAPPHERNPADRARLSELFDQMEQGLIELGVDPATLQTTA